VSHAKQALTVVQCVLYPPYTLLHAMLDSPAV